MGKMGGMKPPMPMKPKKAVKKAPVKKKKKSGDGEMPKK